MGNSAVKYISDREAKELLTQDNWSRLKRQLEKSYDRYIDYECFEEICRCRYERMPKILCEALYKAFADNLNRKISIDDFVITLAVFCNTCIMIFNDKESLSNASKEQRKNLLQFIFRLYDVQSLGKLERNKTEKLLTLAYDYTNIVNTNLTAVINATFPTILLNNMYKQHMDILFTNNINTKSGASGSSITLKEFESYNGNIELLTGWVQTVINSIVYQINPNLYNLDLKYSVKLEKLELMKKYGFSEAFYYQLKHTFIHCIVMNGHLNKFTIPIRSYGNASNSSGANSPNQQQDVKPPLPLMSKPEMTLETWINVTKQLLPTPLACCIFYSKISSIKMVWRFPEFADFCCTFSFKTLQQKVEYIVTGFQVESNQVSKCYIDGSANKSYNLNKNEANDKLHMKRMLKLLAFSDEHIAHIRSLSYRSPSMSATGGAAMTSVEAQPRLPPTPTPDVAGSVVTPSKTSVGPGGTKTGKRVSVNSSTTLSPLDPTASVADGTKKGVTLNDSQERDHMLTPGSADNRIRRSSIISSKFSDYKRPNLQQSVSPSSGHSLRATSAYHASNLSGIDEMEFSTGTYNLPYIYDPYNDPIIESTTFSNTALQTEFEKLQNGSSTQILSYIQLLMKYTKCFVNISMLETLACCIFGIKPPNAAKESEYIKNLLNAIYSSSNAEGILVTPTQPHGPPGTELSIIHKPWFDNWMAYTNAAVAAAGVDNNTNDNNSSSSNALANLRNSMPISAITSTANTVKKNAVASAAAVVSGVTGGRVGGPTTGANGSTPGPINNVPIALKNNNQAILITHNFSNNKILIPKCALGVNVESLPVPVYNALYTWYGGGPTFIRSVIGVPTDSSLNVSAKTTTSVTALSTTEVNPSLTTSQSRKPFLSPTMRRGSTELLHANMKTELELYPLSMKILFCSLQGKIITENYIDLIYSRNTKIETILYELCKQARVETSRGRLWNMVNYQPSSTSTPQLSPRDRDNRVSDTNDQQQFNNNAFYVLPWDITIGKAALKEGQYLLFEICLEDGRWPRTATVTSNPPLPPSASFYMKNGTTTTDSNTTSSSDLKLNDGRVGLENLGNTCYMNSSLQALLHTDLLSEYFLKNSYIRDINNDSKFGFKGKMAKCYYRLVSDLYTNEKNVICPRQFHSEMTSMLNQFGGNDQHDAQELLACLLDGLSEDLNLVHNKPYIQNPDSDGSSEYEQANVWWSNHFKRENSVIQCIFTGQLKSVLTCDGCKKYSSARYEPFTFLTLPVPEDSERVITLFIMLRNNIYALECIVRVHKDDDIKQLIAKIYELNIPGVDLPIKTKTPVAAAAKKNPPTSSGTGPASVSCAHSSTQPVWDSQFLIGEVSNSMVLGLIDVNRKVATIKESENIFVFQLPKIESIATSPTSSPRNTPSANHTTTAAAVIKPTSAAVNNKPHVNTLLKTYMKNTCYRRIILIQRQARCFPAGGIEFHHMETFGLPFVELITSTTTASELYERIAKRAVGYLKLKTGAGGTGGKDGRESTAAVATSANVNNNTNSNIVPYNFEKYSPTAAPRKLSDALLPTEDIDTAEDDSTGGFGMSSPAPTNIDSRPSNPRAYIPNASNTPILPPVTATETMLTQMRSKVPNANLIKPVKTDAVTGGVIPKYGFVLRTVMGYNAFGSGSVCSRCPWLSGCHGCLFPDDPNLLINDCLLDEEVLSIDWHYVIMQEFVDEKLASEIKKHSSVDIEEDLAKNNIIPFSKCLSKFTEEESIEGITCPYCKSDNSMKKSMTLWRGPPVLIVQLKRFQFDSVARRKLIDKIDYPFKDFDISPFYAPTRQANTNTNTKKPESKSSGAVVNMNGQVDSTMLCSEYDLYAVVHHVGRLGDGHYIATVLCNKIDEEDEAEVVDEIRVSDIEMEQEWVCFNDSGISVIDISELKCAPTAYLLFYIRKDMKGHSIDELFGPGGPTFLTEKLKKNHPSNAPPASSTTANNTKSNGVAGETSSQKRNSNSETNSKLPPPRSRNSSTNGPPTLPAPRLNPTSTTDSQGTAAADGPGIAPGRKSTVTTDTRESRDRVSTQTKKFGGKKGSCHIQ